MKRSPKTKSKVPETVFKKGRGYNSRNTGNFWVFIGITTKGRLLFFRGYNDETAYLTEADALHNFDPEDDKEPERGWFAKGKPYLSDHPVTI